ncbi:MAG: T9SS type A sorting domain-containing protein [bacterium]|nr:T9SS type A sorting domain-containing protein [bacterium]
MLIRILFFFTLLFCSSAFTSLRADWQHLPAGNPIATTIVSDSAGQKLLACLEGAGLWLTENGAASWLPINARLSPGDRLSLQGVWAVDAAADTMMASFYSSLTWTCPSARTYDGGDTWHLMPDSSYSCIFVTLPRHHNVWFRLGGLLELELYRSVDYGLNWTRCPRLPMCSLQNLVPDKAHDSTLLCGTYLGGFCATQTTGLFRSTDLGQSWTRVSDFYAQFGIQSGCVVDVARLSNGDLAAIVMAWVPVWSDGSVVISTDEGQTWQRIANSPAGNRDSRLVECPAHPGRLFMSAECPGGIMRSDDFGRTWAVASGGLPTFESYARGLAWNEFSGEMFVLYDYAGVYHSRNCGNTWQPLSLPPTGMPYAAFQTMPEAVFLSRSDYSNYEALPIWAQWELEFPFAAWREFTTPSTIGDSAYWVGPVFEKRADTLFALAGIYVPESLSFGRARLLKSFDDGLSWHAVTGIPGRLVVDQINVLRGDSLTRIVVPVSYLPDSLACTDDFGSTWSVIPCPPVADSSYQKIAQSTQAIYVLADNLDAPENPLSLWRTTDLGVTWDDLNLPASHYYCSGLLPLGDEVFIFRSTTLWHWRNGLWDQRGGLGSHYCGDPQFICIDREDLLLIAVDPCRDSLWMSEDSGYTWMPRNFDYPFSDQNELMGGVVADPYRQRIWTSRGTGIYYLDFSDLSSDGPLIFKPSDFTLLSVYPNPFNSEARIRFDLDRTARVSLRVYDLAGRLVKTMLDDVQAAGRHELTFDGSNLASGTYFVHLRTDRLQRTQKVLMLK